MAPTSRLSVLHYITHTVGPDVRSAVRVERSRAYRRLQLTSHIVRETHSD